MPGKAGANAFFLFMQEYRTREERRGRRFPGGFEGVVQPADEEWAQMSADQKADFKVTNL